MKRGFTLAEVMITLLLIVILMAASLPILTKSLVSNQLASSGPPWEWVKNTPNARFNSSGANIVAMIGMSAAPSGNLPSLAINAISNDVEHINFYQNGSKRGALNISNKGYFIGNYSDVEGFNFNSNSIPSYNKANNTVVLGNATAYGPVCISIGDNTKTAKNSVAIGYNATGAINNSVAIGSGANTASQCSYNTGNCRWNCTDSASLSNNTYQYETYSPIAIGHSAKAYDYDVVIGSGSNASKHRLPGITESTVLGCNSSILGNRSYIIGTNSSLGSGNPTVNNAILIAHNLTILNSNFTCTYGGSSHSISPANTVILGSTSMPVIFVGNVYATNTFYATAIQAGTSTAVTFTNLSDLRLKNLGNEYTSGMDKLNRLKIYNYTFKNEPKKKRVGVVAQELMKIFPDAISKDESGYYVIRQEDIFFAMINAIKDFDKKIKEIIANITNLNKDLTALEEKISNLSKQTEKNSKEIEVLKQKVKTLELKVNSKRGNN